MYLITIYKILKILLNDNNWSKLLFDSKNINTFYFGNDKSVDNNKKKFTDLSKIFKKKQEIVESPQLVALYNAKMWEVRCFSLILILYVFYKIIN